MTKADIIERVYDNLGALSKKESAEIVEMVFETIKLTLAQGEKIKISGLVDSQPFLDLLADGKKIKISGFGNFVVREKKARIGRNPQTGIEIRISPRRVLTFKPSQVLKNSINP